MKKIVNITDAVEITNNRVRPFVGERNYLATGDLIGNEIETIVAVDYETKPSRADLLVSKGDIVVARMKATNKVLLIEKNTKDLIVSTGFLTLTPKNQFDSNYLAQYFKSHIFQRQKDKYCSGSTQKAINNAAFRKLHIPFYSLIEQKKIARILDSADALRQKRRQAVSLLDNFLRAVFLDLFGNPMSIKKKYKTIKLGSAANFVGGGTPNRKSTVYYKGNNLWATSKDMKGLILSDTQEKISDKAIAESATKKIQPGTILVVVKSKILMRYLPVLMAGKEVCFNQDIKGIIVGKELDAWYLLFHMRIGQKALLRVARGANTEGLTLEHLRNYDVILAPKELQKKFSKISERYICLTEEMNKELSQMDNQYNALVDNFFKAAICLKKLIHIIRSC